MSQTLDKVRSLAASGAIRISNHGYDELAEDDIMARDVIGGLASATLVEDYPDHRRGPCVLLRQYDREGKPLHAVWGIPIGKESPAVLVTAYRPDPHLWSDDFLRRRS